MRLKVVEDSYKDLPDKLTNKAKVPLTRLPLRRVEADRIWRTYCADGSPGGLPIMVYRASAPMGQISR